MGHTRRAAVALAAVALSAAGLAALTSPAGASSPTAAVPLQHLGTASFNAGPPGTAGSGDLATEIDQATVGDTDSGDGEDFGAGVNRSLPTAVKGNGRTVNPNKKAKSNPQLGTSFEGLNLYQQRTANGGNQFTVEPPDQALCAGNGYVVEAVNTVLRVFRTDGTAASGVVDLNSFYGYPAAIDRSSNPLKYGPDITDPVCLYDQPTGRFILTVLTLDRVGTSGSLAGTNHLDIAVSKTSNPLGGWDLYGIDASNNGQNGTPDHQCDGGFCLGDYPHIGADANGIYLTTNEFATLGGGFYGAQIYALPKQQLVSGSLNNVVLFNTLGYGPEGGGFTVWPASVPGSTYSGANNGSEFLLSSNAVFYDSGTSSQILQWTLSNTASLKTATPALNLSVRGIPVLQYGVPDRAQQKAGPYPLGQQYGFPLGELDSGDSRMQQVMYANGKVWGSLNTGVEVGGQQHVGIAYYAIKPDSGKVMLQGQTGLPGTDLTYPAVGVTDSGRGLLTFTLTGANDYPSAGYASIDAKVGAGAIHVAAAGVGPQDGFTEYPAFTGQDRPRWGDYGATSVTGNTIWAASEYIAQSCTLTQYLADATCGGTRAPLGNWSTRISKLTP